MPLPDHPIAVRRRTWRHALLLLLLPFVAPGWAAESGRPNFVFILIDDLGWGDVGFHGGRVPTPHLDRLARESRELTQHYANPMCTPTRAAFLSGRYASRFGVTAAQNTRAFPWETRTLASVLRDAGYDTALIGKWHLGSAPSEGPQRFGFDHSYGSLAGGVGPWDHHYKQGPHTKTWHRNGELIEETGHVTDLITQEAVRWLGQRGDRPFFLYLPYTAVHIPIREPETYLERVPAGITLPSHREYAACLIHLDDAIGDVLAALDRTGRAENTVVVFTSDNGGTDAPNDDPKYPDDNYTPGPAGGNNLPLRGRKGQLFEGGIRVPTLIRWPARISPGRHDGLAHAVDWKRTFSGWAGKTPAREDAGDGVDLGPELTGDGAPARRSLYLAGTGFRQQMVREGEWKLILTAAREGMAARAELYHLGRDPYETQDLAPAEPERVARLRALLTDLARDDRTRVAGE